MFVTFCKTDSYQGATFIGAKKKKNEFVPSLKEIHKNKITELLKDHCDWIGFNFHVLSTCHIGGVWEC